MKPIFFAYLKEHFLLIDSSRNPAPNQRKA
jgi:hypothetical protein